MKGALLVLVLIIAPLSAHADTYTGILQHAPGGSYVVVTDPAKQARPRPPVVLVFANKGAAFSAGALVGLPVTVTGTGPIRQFSCVKVEKARR